jgi:hypothetical protein
MSKIKIDELIKKLKHLKTYYKMDSVEVFVSKEGELSEAYLEVNDVYYDEEDNYFSDVERTEGGDWGSHMGLIIEEQ